MIAENSPHEEAGREYSRAMGKVGQFTLESSLARKQYTTHNPIFREFTLYYPDPGKYEGDIKVYCFINKRIGTKRVQ